MSIKIFLLLSLTALSSGGQSSNINVKVSGIRNTKGNILIYLYQGEDGFPTDTKKVFKSVSVPSTGSSIQYTFTNLPAGAYAISAVHDENGNGSIDTNFVGIPKEGTAASNNAKGSIGPPKFKDAQFNSTQQTSLELNISY